MGPRGDALGHESVPFVQVLSGVISSVGGNAGVLRAALAGPGQEMPDEQAASAGPA